MHAAANFNSLPQELGDLIADHVSQLPIKSQRIRTLSCMALVSRRFRHWGHKHLFGSVYVRGTHVVTVGKAFRRLSKLKDLIDADPHSETTGIASHIRSFSLVLSGSLSYLHPLLEEACALPHLLQKIYPKHTGPYLLSILFSVNHGHLDWMALRDDFRCTLIDLVHSVRFSSLRLRGIRNMPVDILACSSIDHITFKDISIQDDMQSENDVENPSSGEQSRVNCIQPTSIETDHSFPILRILDFTPTPKHCILQRLTSLTIKINDSDGFTKSEALFRSAPNIERLEIQLNWTSSSGAALSFQSLQALRCLKLVHRIYTPRSMPSVSDGCPHRTVQDMIKLLKCSQLPQTLCSVSINFSLSPVYGNCFYPETHCEDQMIVQAAGMASAAQRDRQLPSGAASVTHGFDVDEMFMQAAGSGTATVSNIPHSTASSPPVINVDQMIVQTDGVATTSRDMPHLDPSVTYVDEMLVHAPGVATASANGMPHPDASLAICGLDVDQMLMQVACSSLPISCDIPHPNGAASNSNEFSVKPITPIGGGIPHPKSETDDASSFPPTMTIIKRMFAPWSPERNIFKPLDDLFESSSIIDSPDRFASFKSVIFQLKVDVHRTPREYAESRGQEFADEAARYVRSEFFPRVKDRFERSDRSGGGFFVEVSPKFRKLGSR